VYLKNHFKVFHRDIKPENIGVFSEAHFAILDFGESKYAINDDIKSISLAKATLTDVKGKH